MKQVKTLHISTDNEGPVAYTDCGIKLYRGMYGVLGYKWEVKGVNPPIPAFYRKTLFEALDKLAFHVRFTVNGEEWKQDELKRPDMASDFTQFWRGKVKRDESASNDLFKKGYTCEEIAYQLRTRITSVRRYVNPTSAVWGELAVRRESYPQSDYGQINFLRDCGYSHEEIRSKTGFSNYRIGTARRLWKEKRKAA